MKTVFLPIDVANLGYRRAVHVFTGSRYAAQRLDPAVQIAAVYRDHQRVGWNFVIDPAVATRLRACHLALLAGRGIGQFLP